MIGMRLPIVNLALQPSPRRRQPDRVAFQFRKAGSKTAFICERQNIRYLVRVGAIKDRSAVLQVGFLIVV